MAILGRLVSSQTKQSYTDEKREESQHNPTRFNVNNNMVISMYGLLITII